MIDDMRLVIVRTVVSHGPVGREICCHQKMQIVKPIVRVLVVCYNMLQRDPMVL